MREPRLSIYCIWLSDVWQPKRKVKRDELRDSYYQKGGCGSVFLGI